jgi:hypothetical protein
LRRPSKPTSTLLHPIQQLVLDAYVGRDVLPEKLEEALRVLDLDGDGHTHPELDAAVAAVLLQSIQRRLPQWAHISVEGHVTLGRNPKRRPALATFHPSHLFTINWATSGPGISWPEAYYAIKVPSHDVVVVTASADSPDLNGFTDVAIGWFSTATPFERGVHDVIAEYWTRSGGERWEDFVDDGDVDEVTANAWADEVWEGT